MLPVNVKDILSAPITLLRPSNEEEKGLFHNHDAGWFYTFGLKSGQSFVAHFNKTDDIFVFRPLKNLVPQLMQVQWEKRRTYGVFPECWTTCRVIAGTSDQEKALLEEILGPVRGNPPKNSLYPFSYYYPEMLARVSQVKNQLVENERILLNTRLQLQEGQKRLKKMLIPEGGNSTNQIIQQKITQERRKQNG